MSVKKLLPLACALSVAARQANAETAAQLPDAAELLRGDGVDIDNRINHVEGVDFDREKDVVYRTDANAGDIFVVISLQGGAKPDGH